MNYRTQKLKRYRTVLSETILSNPEARLVKNRYRLMRKAILDQFPQTFEGISKETMLELLKDVCTLDREIRLFTQGYDQENKDLLEQEKLVEINS